MKNNRMKHENKSRRAVCRLAAVFCNICLLAGGLAVLCGFGMSDTMTASRAFCTLLSAGGAAAMVLGLRLQRLQKQ